MKSNSSKLTGDTNDAPIDVELRMEDEEDAVDLQDLPIAEEPLSDAEGLFVSDDEAPRRSKRPRTTTIVESDDDFTPEEPLSKRLKDTESLSLAEDQSDDKKKMAMDTTYDGFSIYGRVLCLIVKRKDKTGKHPAIAGGQAMMEDWITSTQMPLHEEDD